MPGKQRVLNATSQELDPPRDTAAGTSLDHVDALGSLYPVFTRRFLDRPSLHQTPGSHYKSSCCRSGPRKSI